MVCWWRLCDGYLKLLWVLFECCHEFRWCLLFYLEKVSSFSHHEIQKFCLYSFQSFPRNGLKTKLTNEDSSHKRFDIESASKHSSTNAKFRIEKVLDFSENLIKTFQSSSVTFYIQQLNFPSKQLISIHPRFT
jgi:hypothetical protein